MASSTQPVVAQRACSACIYWKPVAEERGECRRHAPQTVTFEVDENVKFEWRFPETKALDWCGDFTV